MRVQQRPRLTIARGGWRAQGQTTLPDTVKGHQTGQPVGQRRHVVAAMTTAWMGPGLAFSHARLLLSRSLPAPAGRDTLTGGCVAGDMAGKTAPTLASGAASMRR